MSIITISHDPYSHGKEIAESVAEDLGFSSIGPEIIEYACHHLDFPSWKLEKALHNVPTFLEKLGAKREQYLALFRSVFFDRMAQDNIVYHGVAGHIFIAGVPNVLKVRIITDFEERIAEKTQKENLSPEDAKKILLRQDKERARWTKYLYGKDNHDPRLYDLYLNLHNIQRKVAVSTIVGTARLSRNGHEEMMRRRLKDMALAAKTEARLLEVFPEVEAVAKEGQVFVSVNGSILQEDKIVNEAKQMVSEIEGIEGVSIGVSPTAYVPF